MSKNTKLLLIIFAIMALILGVWVGKSQFKQTPPPGGASTVFTPPQEITQFSLIDSKGRPFNNNSLWGHWTFLFFGFTNCGQICPPAMANLNKMYGILLQQQQNPMPQVVFISIDPERDTLQKIGSYVTTFNPHFQGATGDKDEIDKLAASLNVLYLQTTKDPKSKDYSIDHSGAFLLIDPSGKLSAVFSMPHDPEAIVKDFQLIVENSG